MTDIDRRAKLIAQFSIPVDELYGHDGDPYRHIYADLAASDEQLLSEFAHWLACEREGLKSELPKRRFDQSDFLNWHNVGVLPYIDLVTIARVENISIPLHVIADAIFADEVGVDVVERVRKVTKKKAAQICRYSTVAALNIQ